MCLVVTFRYWFLLNMRHVWILVSVNFAFFEIVILVTYCIHLIRRNIIKKIYLV